MKMEGLLHMHYNYRNSCYRKIPISNLKNTSVTF